MDDWDGPDLTPLRPGVDHDASRRLFDRRRHRRRQRRRAVVSAGLATALVGVLAVGAAIRTDEGASVITDAGVPAPTPVGFEVLAVQPTESDFGRIAAATDWPGLARLWVDLGFEGSPPPVDFGADMVVSLTIPDDACPPELTQLTRDAGTITPVFEEDPTLQCEQPLNRRNFLVAVERATVEPGFTLRLPAHPMFDYEEQRLRVELAEQGTVEVTFELANSPFFIEGFDYAVRFRNPTGAILAERWYDEFERPIESASRATFSLPPGEVTVESHLTVGIGPGPRRPDFVDDPFGQLCRAMLPVAPGRSVFTLDWDTGCLVERPIVGDAPVDVVRNWLFAVQEDDLDLALRYVADDLEAVTRELFRGRDRLEATVVATADTTVRTVDVQFDVITGPPLRTVPPCRFPIVLSDDLKITEAMSCPLPPPG